MKRLETETSSTARTAVISGNKSLSVYAHSKMIERELLILQRRLYPRLNFLDSKRN